METEKFKAALGAAIEKAAATLPQGYSVEIVIEREGYGVWLRGPKGYREDMFGETIITDIALATAKALENSRQQQDGGSHEG